MTTSLPEELLGRLVPAFEAAREPERAVPAAAYMRDQFAFLGFSTPAQRALARGVVAGLPKPTEQELRAVALACWDLEERSTRRLRSRRPCCSDGPPEITSGGARHPSLAHTSRWA
jgi:hypothetical protein